MNGLWTSTSTQIKQLDDNEGEIFHKKIDTELSHILDNDDEGDLKIDGDCGLTRQTRTTCSLGRE